MKEPVDHILRTGLPWRDDETAITECGIAADQTKTITRAEYVARRKDLGQQRAAMFTCMTCSQTSDRWGRWEEDPRVALAREIEWERGGAYYRARNDRGERLKDELLAIFGLIEVHRDEFDAAIKASEGRREWLERKAAMERKPKSSPSRSL